MKFLLVIDSLGSGGAQRLFAHLAKSFKDSEHIVEIFTYQKNGDFFHEDFTSEGIKVHALESDVKGFSFEVLWKLYKLVRSDFDCVIATMHAPSIYAALASITFGRKKLIICEVSSSVAPISQVKKTLFRLSCLLAHSVVTNSFSEAKYLSRFPFINKKLKTIWNGYQINDFPFQINYKKSKKNFKILIVGRLAYPKNGKNILLALQEFYIRNGWMPKVTWAGRKDTDSRSIKMQSEMELLLEKDNILRENFSFIGEVRDIHKYYNLSDLLLHASLYEGLPNVICEAMLLGCFVVASRVADHQLILGDGDRGLLCDPTLPSSICKSIEKAVNLPKFEFDQTILRARKFAENEFDINLMTNSLKLTNSLTRKKGDKG